jgi:3-phenylpropionate/trans-cinnamate dioxygenase ferredoxin reductase component
MAPELQRIVIVGGSLAGATAAATLRERGFDGNVVVIGAEDHPPYERPPLSKALLLGETDDPDWVRPFTYYVDQEIRVEYGTRVTEIRPREHLVLAGGEYPYDRLVLATGSRARRLRVPGADLDGVLTLRTLDDAHALRRRLTEEAQVVVVGAGWIGCEVAAAARHAGSSVIMLDPARQPLVRVVGEEIGQVFADLHREHGVDVQLGTGVQGFAGDRRVRSLFTDDDREISADTVVVGVGAQPNLELAERAGLALDGGGVAVDAELRTSDPDIYAIGDIAAHQHPELGVRVRVEHWANAKDQGEHVAGNVLGGHEPYRKRPFFFSDQYDLGCEYRGLADPARDRLVVRGDLGSRVFTAFWLRDGAVAAAMNVNSWDDGDALQALVDSGRPVDEADLIRGDPTGPG